MGNKNTSSNNLSRKSNSVSGWLSNIADFARYKDDERLEVSEVSNVQSESISNTSRLIVYAKPATNYLQLNSSQPQELPCSIVFQAAEASSEDTGNRQGLDVVCIIDVSGSMQGEKMDLTKKTLEFMTEHLTEKDRMCLITFQSGVERLCPLIIMNENGKARAKAQIANIHASGGTELVEGLLHGVKVLESRRIENNVSSIILLSDGQDNNSSTALDRAKDVITSSRLKNYSIHTFGYGTDHDAGLLNSISE